jgi:UDP-N-acetylglucosamine 2-epimerase (non-hydrolysing)
MNKKNALSVVTIVGTRPEIIKLSEVMKLLDQHVDHTIIHTGQNYDYELNEIFFEQLGVRKPDYFLDAAKGTPAETIGEIISKTDSLLRNLKPEAVLLYGDTNSCLSVIAAKRLKIPIFHMEAGNRCFDQRVPEEINRKIVDHLSDINLPLSEQARDYLIAEGLKPETVIKIGSPMQEVLLSNMQKIDASNILKDEGLTQNNYFLMSIHREENVDSKENFSNLINAIEGISEEFNLPIIVSTHPRTRKKLEEMQYESSNSLIRFSKPYGFHEYNKLQKEAFCVISDSGTITEEASILKLNAITIRQAHERPEGMDEGTVVMSGLEKNRVLQSIKAVTSNDCPPTKIISDYDVTNVSTKILRIILSYTDYVNRTVWHKE